MSDSSSALSSPGSSHSLPLTDDRSLSSAPSSDGPTAPDTGAAGNDDDDGNHLSPSVVDACAAVVLSSSSSVSSRSAYRPSPGQSDAVRPLPLLNRSPGPPASLMTDDPPLSSLDLQRQQPQPTIVALPSQASVLPSGPGGFGRHRGLLLSRPSSAQAVQRRTSTPLSAAAAAVGSPGRPMTRLQLQQQQQQQLQAAHAAAEATYDERHLAAQSVPIAQKTTTRRATQSRSRAVNADSSHPPSLPLLPARRPLAGPRTMEAVMDDAPVEPVLAPLARLDAVAFSSHPAHRPDQRRAVSDPTLFDGGLPTAMPALFTARPALGPPLDAMDDGRLASDGSDADDEDDGPFAPGQSTSALFDGAYQQQQHQQQIFLPQPSSHQPHRPRLDVFHDRGRAVSSPSSTAFPRPSSSSDLFLEHGASLPPPPGAGHPGYPSYPAPYGFHPAYGFAGGYPYPPLHAYSYGSYDPSGLQGYGPPPPPTGHPAHAQPYPHPSGGHWRPPPFPAGGGGWGHPYAPAAAYHPAQHAYAEDSSHEAGTEQLSTCAPVLGGQTGADGGGESSVDPHAIQQQRQQQQDEHATTADRGPMASTSQHARSSSDWSTLSGEIASRSLGHHAPISSSETDDVEAEVDRLNRGGRAHQLVRMDSDEESDDDEMEGNVQYVYDHVDRPPAGPTSLLQRRQQRNLAFGKGGGGGPSFAPPGGYPHLSYGFSHPAPGFYFPFPPESGSAGGPPFYSAPGPSPAAPVPAAPPKPAAAASASLAARRKKSNVLRLKLAPSTSAAAPAPSSRSSVLSGGISKKKKRGGGGGGSASSSAHPRNVVLRPLIVPNLNKPTRGRAVPSDPDEVRKRRGNDNANVYTCPATGCGRCFARPEHLRRFVSSPSGCWLDPKGAR